MRALDFSKALTSPYPTPPDRTKPNQASPSQMSASLPTHREVVNMGPQTPLAKYFKPRVARVTKRTVGYRPATGERDCGNCVMFHKASASCDLVYGQIRSGDVCDRWEARKV